MKDEWCTMQGIKAHKEGMYKNEKKMTKICVTVLFGVSAAVYLICSALCMERSVNAGGINEDFEGTIQGGFLGSDGIPVAYEFDNVFNSCNIPAYFRSSDLSDEDFADLLVDYADFCDGDKACYEKGTGWTEIWAYNAAIMFLQAVNFVVMAIGGFFWYPRLFGTVINFICAATFHLAAVILLFGGRLSPPGDICSYNISPNTYDSDD